ncbi:MAG: hypothetical protein AAFX94_08410, partial [Myxococcota bacterium]
MVNRSDEQEPEETLTGTPSLSDGADQLHRAVAEALGGLDLSDTIRSYLVDPGGIADDARAGVLAALIGLFERNPTVAEKLATGAAAGRARFDALRAEAGTAESGPPNVSAINVSECGTLATWLEQDGLVIEALFAADLPGAPLAAARGELARWVWEVQARYGQSVLLDPALSKVAADLWHEWLEKDRSSLGRRYRELTLGFGEPLERVPLVFHSAELGSPILFNAYLLCHEGKWTSFNSIDGRGYSGAGGRDQSLRDVAENSRLGHGTVSVVLDGEVQTFESKERQNSGSPEDIGMGTVDPVLLALLGTMEQSVFVWGADAVRAMVSAGCVDRGASLLAELVREEKTGLNAATGTAVRCLATGLLMRLRSHGSAPGAETSSHSYQQTQLTQVGRSAGLILSEHEPDAGGLERANSELFEILNDEDLSDEEI